jgi:hypothetical protein
MYLISSYTTFLSKLRNCSTKFVTQDLLEELAGDGLSRIGESGSFSGKKDNRMTTTGFLTELAAVVLAGRVGTLKK